MVKICRGLTLCMLLVVSTLYLFFGGRTSAIGKQRHDQTSRTRLSSSCETIHVVIVCVGYTATKDVASLTKSLLYYRTRPVHLHLITDEIAQHILKVLFQTWDVSDLYFSFYPIEKARYDVACSVNANGITKLVSPQLLPREVDRVIVLDADVAFFLDVAELWDFFASFTHDQMIGLVENQHDLYLEATTRRVPWPLLGRGFDIGVMLLHLKRLRSIDWSTMWCSVVEKRSIPYRQQADRDIINTIIVNYPQLVHRLPWFTNVQLSSDASTLADLFQNGLKHSKMIVHWSSLKGEVSKGKRGRFFQKLKQTLDTLDANILRVPQFQCNDSRAFKTEDFMNDDDDCFELRQGRDAKFRTHLFYFPFLMEDVMDKNDVTWVSQLSFDRLHMIEKLIPLWEGPISLALYLYEAEVELFENFILESEYLRSRTNVAYHIIYKQGSSYPVNLLRNTALEQARTPFVFLNDIDFIPMPNSYLLIKRAIEKLHVESGNKALVVPAFENLRNKFQYVHSKKKIIEYYNDGIVSVFNEFVFDNGHRPTNFTLWEVATEPYKVPYVPLFEPYIVVRQNVTRYSTRFSGYGWNKVFHILELNAQNYEFVVLPDTFIVHQPHALGIDSLKFHRSDEYNKCLNQIQCETVRIFMDQYGYKVIEEDFKFRCE